MEPIYKTAPYEKSDQCLYCLPILLYISSFKINIRVFIQITNIVEIPNIYD